MSDEIHPSAGQPVHPEVRFEPSDVSFGWIVSIMIGAIAVVAIIQVSVLAFFQGYKEHLDMTLQSTYPLAPGPSVALPPEPRLEQLDRLFPPAQMREGYLGQQGVSAHERALAKLRTLNSYGPGESRGFVHIPIERAMKLMVKENILKARPAASVKKVNRSAGLVDAGESDSGRLFQGEKQ